MFVHAVNLGPMFIRRKFYNEIDGFNLEQIGIGNHMIGMDWDLCLRAWKNNKYVGLYEINGINRRVGGNMSSVLSLEKRETTKLKNHKYLNEKYNNKNFLYETSKIIKKLNNKNW
jgi:hypothetical protein